MAATDEGAIATRWREAADLLRANRDVLDARPIHGDVPSALASRGWSDALLGLEDAALEALESRGFDAPWPAGTPASLVALAAAARDVCDLPMWASGPHDRAPRRHETPRKRAQVDAFVAAALPYATRARRVVDVGSGHGHLTRALAERMELPVIGLERDEALAARARILASQSLATFATTDVLADALPLAPGDCAIGLHACGELGDAMVERVAAVGASLVLVGCCPQKRRASHRRSLVAPEDAQLDFSTRLLGLGNLTARDVGVEAERRENLDARARRLALHGLLEARLGVPLRYGAEMDGLNRRAAHEDLASLVRRAFEHHGQPLPTDIEVADAATKAQAQHAVARRLSLPRALLARVLEVFVLYDRAAWLAGQGHAVDVGLVFPAAVSARNLGLRASSSCLG